MVVSTRFRFTRARRRNRVRRTNSFVDSTTVPAGRQAVQRDHVTMRSKI